MKHAFKSTILPECSCQHPNHQCSCSMPYSLVSPVQVQLKAALCSRAIYLHQHHTHSHIFRTPLMANHLQHLASARSILMLRLSPPQILQHHLNKCPQTSCSHTRNIGPLADRLDQHTQTRIRQTQLRQTQLRQLHIALIVAFLKHRHQLVLKELSHMQHLRHKTLLSHLQTRVVYLCNPLFTIFKTLTRAKVEHSIQLLIQPRRHTATTWVSQTWTPQGTMTPQPLPYTARKTIQSVSTEKLCTATRNPKAKSWRSKREDITRNPYPLGFPSR